MARAAPRRTVFMPAKITPSGVERFFQSDEIIVSKPDTKGRITYANDVFLRVAGYSEKEILNQPHSIVRHPDMPRSVFKLLWDTIEAKNEIFAYVLNMAKNGDHYWVLAHVTPTLNEAGDIISYHSNRRVPDREVVSGTIAPLYKALLDEEAKYNNAKEGMMAGVKMLTDLLKSKNVSYDELVFSLALGSK